MKNIQIADKTFPFPERINMAVVKQWEVETGLKFTQMDTKDIEQMTVFFYICITDEAEARDIELSLTQKQFDRMLTSDVMVMLATAMTGDFTPNVESSYKDEVIEGNGQ